MKKTISAEHTLPQDREACVCTTVRGLARHATVVYDAFLAPAGIKVTQYAVLTRLDRLVRCSLGELSKACDLDVTSLSRAVRPLIDAGFVRVGRGKDARTKRYELTARGRHLLARAFELWKKAQDRVRRVISPEQLRMLGGWTTALRAL